MSRVNDSEELIVKEEIEYESEMRDCEVRIEPYNEFDECDEYEMQIKKNFNSLKECDPERASRLLNDLRSTRSSKRRRRKRSSYYIKSDTEESDNTSSFRYTTLLDKEPEEWKILIPQLRYGNGVFRISLVGPKVDQTLAFLLENKSIDFLSPPTGQPSEHNKVFPFIFRLMAADLGDRMSVLSGQAVKRLIFVVNQLVQLRGGGIIENVMLPSESPERNREQLNYVENLSFFRKDLGDILCFLPELITDRLLISLLKYSKREILAPFRRGDFDKLIRKGDIENKLIVIKALISEMVAAKMATFTGERKVYRDVFAKVAPVEVAPVEVAPVEVTPVEKPQVEKPQVEEPSELVTLLSGGSPKTS